MLRPIAHRSEEEIWCVIAARGPVGRCPPGARAEPVEIYPGHALVIPAGWRFQFRAAAGADLRFLCFTAPPWPGPHEAEPAGPGALGDLTV